MEPSTRQVVWRVCELSHLCGSLDITRRGKEMLSSLLPGKNQVEIESWRDTWKLLSILAKSSLETLSLVKYRIFSELPPPSKCIMRQAIYC